jgi:hypothetical protein
MNNKNIAILTIGIVLAIGVLCLVFFQNEKMKNWIKENVFCCFGKKKVEKMEEKVEDNFEREDREMKEKLDEMGKELDEMGKELNAIKECLRGGSKSFNDGLDKIEFLLKNRPEGINDNDKDKSIGND